ncbi:hypothetical protein GQ53DRAFT_669498, partial [Thozetella sp. PMI_491]
PSASNDDCQQTVIQGLGGVGKTQVALEVAYLLRNSQPNCSIFWVPAITETGFENAYRKIGDALGINDINDDNADVIGLVKRALTESRESWLLIIDNADDIELVFGRGQSGGLIKHLPFSLKGSILLTTRNLTVAVRFARSNVIRLQQMSRDEAIKLLCQGINLESNDLESLGGLADFLYCLPLAIRQASAYMAATSMPATAYLQHCQSSDKTLVQLLSKDFDDQGRYQNSSNPIVTTWLISFKHIQRDNPTAARYLKFICFLGEKNIPFSLLPPGNDELDKDEAIGTLLAYAFIILQDGTFNTHRLVGVAMRNWLNEESELEDHITSVIQHLARIFPQVKYETRDTWMNYLPHTQRISESQVYCRDSEAKFSLFSKIGQCYIRFGNYTEAEKLSRQMLQLSESLYSQEHPSTVSSIGHLGLVLQRLGRYEEAEQLHRKELQLSEKIHGPEHPDTITSIGRLGLVLQKLDRYEEAKQLHRKQLQLSVKVHGPEHPNTIRRSKDMRNFSQGRDARCRTSIDQSKTGFD